MRGITARKDKTNSEPPRRLVKRRAKIYNSQNLRAMRIALKKKKRKTTPPMIATLTMPRPTLSGIPGPDCARYLGRKTVIARRAGGQAARARVAHIGYLHTSLPLTAGKRDRAMERTNDPCRRTLSVVRQSAATSPASAREECAREKETKKGEGVGGGGGRGRTNTQSRRRQIPLINYAESSWLAFAC